LAMKVTITLCGGERPSGVEEMSKTFGPEGGSIGRAANNDWVLPDPHLSKTHCFVGFRDGAFTITDVSTNGLYMNDEQQRVTRGQTRPLHDGDRLRMGEYKMQISLVEGAAGAKAAPPPADKDDDDFAALLSGGPASKKPVGEANPFSEAAPEADFMPEPPTQKGSAQDDISDLLGEGGAGRRPAGGGGIPEDYDPLAESFSDEGGFGAGADAGQWREAAEPDHLPAEAQFFAPPKVSHNDALPSEGSQIPEDWLLDEDDRDAGGLSRPAPAQRKPPRPRPGRSAPAAAPPQPVPTGPSGDAETLLKAFLEGAGVQTPKDIAGSEAEFMRAVGQSYLEMVRGLCELLRVRQSIKNEFRLEKTVIQSGGNNPLKFSVSPEEAVRALLYPAEAGYLAADEAISEGIDDVKAHQLAVMAGMQVALGSLLKNFDPNSLEQRLQDSSVLGNILPGAKKARYWEAFTELYKEIAQEAESDFYGLFGQAFARAYEEQINRLKSGR
jgi:type VI secretion system protein